MTVCMLKQRHLNNYPNSHFFDYDTLKFFGERMSEMRVLNLTTKVKDQSGNIREVYCLSSLQHNAPGGKRRAYHYFDVRTFEHVIL